MVLLMLGSQGMAGSSPGRSRLGWQCWDGGEVPAQLWGWWHQECLCPGVWHCWGLSWCLSQGCASHRLTPLGCYLQLHLEGLQRHSGVCGEGEGIVFTLGLSGGAGVAPAQLPTKPVGKTSPEWDQLHDHRDQHLRGRLWGWEYGSCASLVAPALPSLLPPTRGSLGMCHRAGTGLRPWDGTWGCIPGMELHPWQPWLSLGSCGGSVSPVQSRAQCPPPLPVLPSLASGTCLPQARCAWPRRGLWCLAQELELGRHFSLTSTPPPATGSAEAEPLSPGGAPEPWWSLSALLPAGLLPSKPILFSGRIQAELGFFGSCLWPGTQGCITAQACPVSNCDLPTSIFPFQPRNRQISAAGQRFSFSLLALEGRFLVLGI